MRVHGDVFPECEAQASAPTPEDAPEPAKPTRNLPEFTTVSGHTYRPDPDLVNLWDASEPGEHVLFLGPSGCGKTEAAQYLAMYSGLDFVKVDCPSMTEPEAWFGTRELEVKDGHPETVYRPSSFVQAIGRPCVLLLDEVNRTRDADRNILLPILDNTAQVTNPLTGEPIVRDPGCRIIMTGNNGAEHTGTFAMDAAFVSRAAVVEFAYADPERERAILHEACGKIAKPIVNRLVNFAAETRQRAGDDAEFPAVSTRNLIAAGKRIARGLDVNLAVQYCILNGADTLTRQQLTILWEGGK